MRSRGNLIHEATFDLIFPVLGIALLLLVNFMAQLDAGSAGMQSAGGEDHPASPMPPNAIFIKISSAATIHVKGQRTDLVGLKNAVADLHFRTPGAPVILMVEDGARASLIFRVMEQCKAASAKDIRFMKI